jgi:hypothetical protein
MIINQDIFINWKPFCEKGIMLPYYTGLSIILLSFFICIMHVQNVNGISVDNITEITAAHGSIGPRWESAVGENSLYVGWIIGNDSNTDNVDLFFKRFTDDGKTNIIPLKVAHGDIKDFRIAAIANKVFIVWYDRTEGKEGIYLKRSLDNGGTFGATVNLLKGPFSLITPTGTGAVTTDKDLYIAYHNASDSKIRILTSNDNGDSIRITNVPNITNKEIRGMAAQYNYVYILLAENPFGSSNLFFTRSSDHGGSFEDTRKLSDNGQHGARMAVSKNSIYVVAFDRPGTSIFFMMSDNNGDSFRSIPILTNLWVPTIESIENDTMKLDHTLLSEPAIAAFENNVYLLWSSRSSLYTVDRNGTIGNYISGIDSVNQAVSFNNGDYFYTVPINLRQYSTNIHVNKETPNPVYTKISTIGNISIAVWRDETSNGNGNLFMVAGSSHENKNDLDFINRIKFKAVPLNLSNSSSMEPFNWKIESSGLRNAYVIWDQAEPFKGQKYPRNFEVLFRKLH